MNRCRVVNGRDLMKAFKLSQGPIIGKVLKELKIWEDEHHHHVTKEMAFSHIRKNIKLK